MRTEESSIALLEEVRLRNFEIWENPVAISFAISFIFAVPRKSSVSVR